MKAVFHFACFLSLGAVAGAVSDAEREFQRIVQERNDSLVAAAEPINRAYQSALEQLLHRATQTGDVEAATKAKEALKAFDLKNSSVITDIVPPGSRIINSTWVWWGDQTITFEKGGKVRWSNGEIWTWSPDSHSNSIKGETSTANPFSITFNPDYNTGTLHGAVNGPTHRIEK